MTKPIPLSVSVLDDAYGKAKIILYPKSKFDFEVDISSKLFLMRHFARPRVSDMASEGVSLAAQLTNISWDPETFQCSTVGQLIIDQWLRALFPDYSTQAINRLFGLPAVLVATKKPRGKISPGAIAQWSESHQFNPVSRGPARKSKQCFHCMGTVVTNLVPDFAKYDKSNKFYCRACYDRYRGRVALGYRRDRRVFMGDRYKRRPIGSMPQFAPLKEKFNLDLRDIWAKLVPSVTKLEDGSTASRQRGLLYVAHPWRVAFKSTPDKAPELGTFVALFHETPQRAVSLHWLLRSASLVWNQDWALMRSWGRIKIENFSKALMDANPVVHDACNNSRPSERALFIFCRNNMDRWFVSVEMAAMLHDVMISKSIELCVVLDSPTRPNYPPNSISTALFDGMTRAGVQEVGIYISEAQNITWASLCFLVDRARRAYKAVREGNALKVTLHGSYYNAISLAKTGLHGIRLGYVFVEIIDAIRKGHLLGSVQMHGDYEPSLEPNALMADFARQEITAFKTNAWPPLNPTPIDPESQGCTISLADVIIHLGQYPDSFQHYDLFEYPEDNASLEQ